MSSKIQCRGCRKEIDKDAIICQFCQSDQTLLGRFQISIPALGLCAALAGLGLSYLQYFKDYLFPPRAELIPNFKSGEVRKTFLVTNVGETKAFIHNSVSCEHSDEISYTPKPEDELLITYLELGNIISIEKGETEEIRFNFNLDDAKERKVFKGMITGQTWPSLCTVSYFDKHIQAESSFKSVKFMGVFTYNSAQNIEILIHREDSLSVGFNVDKLNKKWQSESN